jgi:hypothetical protein
LTVASEAESVPIRAIFHRLSKGRAEQHVAEFANANEARYASSQ